MPSLPSWLVSDTTCFCISLYSFGSGLFQTVFRFYYVRVFLEHYDISQRWLNTAQIAYIFANTINEPLMGFFQDFGCQACRNRGKIILIGGPLSALAFLAPWFAPYDPKTAPGWVPAVHLMVVLFLWNFFFVLNGVAISGIFAEVSTDQVFRARLFKYQIIAGLLGSAVIFPVDKISKSLRDFTAFQITCVILAAISSACSIVTGLKTPREVAQLQRLSESEEDGSIESENPNQLGTVEEDGPVKAALKVVGQVFSSKNFWCAVTGNFTGWLRTCIISNFLAIFTEILIPVSILPPGSFRIAFFFGLCTVGSSVAAALATPIAARRGSYFVIQSHFVLTWLNCAVGLFLGQWVGYAALFPVLFFECALASFQRFYAMTLSEFIDEDAKKYKRKFPPSALIFSLNGMLVRPSVGIAPIIVVHLLNSNGEYSIYKNNLQAASDSLKHITFLTATCLPAALALLGFLVMIPYNIRGKIRSQSVTEKIEDEQDGTNGEDQQVVVA